MEFIIDYYDAMQKDDIGIMKSIELDMVVDPLYLKSTLKSLIYYKRFDILKWILNKKQKIFSIDIEYDIDYWSLLNLISLQKEKDCFNIFKSVYEEYLISSKIITDKLIKIIVNACYGGNLEIVKYCWEKGGNEIKRESNKLKNDNNLAFCRSCKSNNLELVNYLIDIEPSILIDVNELHSDSFENIINSLGNSSLEIIKFIIDSVPNLINKFYVGELLQTFINYGNLKAIKYIFDNSTIEKEYFYLSVDKLSELDKNTFNAMHCYDLYNYLLYEGGFEKILNNESNICKINEMTNVIDSGFDIALKNSNIDLFELLFSFCINDLESNYSFPNSNFVNSLFESSNLSFIKNFLLKFGLIKNDSKCIESIQEENLIKLKKIYPDGFNRSVDSYFQTYFDEFSIDLLISKGLNLNYFELTKHKADLIDLLRYTIQSSPLDVLIFLFDSNPILEYFKETYFISKVIKSIKIFNENTYQNILWIIKNKKFRFLSDKNSYIRLNLNLLIFCIDFKNLYRTDKGDPFEMIIIDSYEKKVNLESHKSFKMVNFIYKDLGQYLGLETLNTDVLINLFEENNLISYLLKICSDLFLYNKIFSIGIIN